MSYCIRTEGDLDINEYMECAQYKIQRPTEQIEDGVEKGRIGSAGIVFVPSVGVGDAQHVVFEAFVYILTLVQVGLKDVLGEEGLYFEEEGVGVSVAD